MKTRRTANHLIILLSLVLTLSCGGGNDSTKGGLSEDACSVLGPKIFNGTSCALDKSTVVNFEVIYSDRPPTFCSGSVVSRNKVLTAGHCFPDRGAAVTEVVVILSDTVIPAIGVTIHPDYREDQEAAAIFNDVAVITLQTEVQLEPLPFLSSAAPEVGDIINIFGYGVDEGGSSGTLKSGQMRLSAVTADHLFAEFGSDGSNTCLGDSGGPALVQLPSGAAAIAGITSSGDANAACRQGDISLFTNIQKPEVFAFISANVPELSVR